MPAAGASHAFRNSLWIHMEKLMDQIYGCCAQVGRTRAPVSRFLSRFCPIYVNLTQPNLT